MKNWCVIILVLITTGSLIMAQNTEIQKETIAGHTLYEVLEKGEIPGIYNPEYYSAKDADSFYFENEPLMIVANNGIAHAYSTWHLDHHEIVNDRIGDLPLAATW